MVGLTSIVIAVSLGFAVESPKNDSSSSASNVREPKIKDEKLRQELLRRLRVDQEARIPMLALMQQSKGTDPEEIKKKDLPAVKHMKEIDQENTDRMKQIIDQFGWPGKSLVGADGANAAWILVQHADLDRPFQRKCLELLETAMKKGEATGSQFAYLTDRVRLGEKKKQVYGSQFQVVDGKLQPYPIENEAEVDKRRKEVGLPSLADYLKSSQWLLERAAKSGPTKEPGKK